MRRLLPWILGVWTVFLAIVWTIAILSYPSDVLPTGVAAIMTLVVGGVLLGRGKGGWIGPVLVIGASAGLVYDLGTAYALAWLSRVPPLPGSYTAAWLGAWTAPIMFLSLPALLVLFPDGRFSGGRKWFLPFFAVVVGLTLVGAVQLWGVPIETLVSWEQLDVTPEYQIMNPAFVFSFFALVPPAVLSLAWRFWRGDSIVRQQIKWLLTAATVVPLSAFAVNIVLPEVLGPLLLGAAACAAPLTLGAAVLRYRLYDIDRIISRTVSYTLVVGLLAAVFATGVVWIPSALGLGDSQLLVAASTLAVAALFNPIRRRVQTWVDRRFNRSRYDAEQVIDQFAGSLRDRVDPDGVVDGWVGVVSETMQPSSVGVWVKE